MIPTRKPRCVTHSFLSLLKSCLRAKGRKSFLFSGFGFRQCYIKDLNEWGLHLEKETFLRFPEKETYSYLFNVVPVPVDELQVEGKRELGELGQGGLETFAGTPGKMQVIVGLSKRLKIQVLLHFCL